MIHFQPGEWNKNGCIRRDISKKDGYKPKNAHLTID